ncbi:MAG: metallophosphoesterase family protein [Dehalococcoidia bacterium]
MRIGLIADTHLPSLVRSLDELGPQIADVLRSVDLILHAGDVTAPSVLEWCGQFAPLLVAEGNNDLFHDPRMEKRQMLDIEGWRIGMAHELRPESRPIDEILRSSLGGERVDILIGGDTHVERLEFREDVLLINSGSPILPHHLSTRLGTVGVLEITRTRVHAEIVVLGHSEGLPNPCTAMQIELTPDQLRRNGGGATAEAAL